MGRYRWASAPLLRSPSENPSALVVAFNEPETPRTSTVTSIWKKFGVLYEPPKLVNRSTEFDRLGMFDSSLSMSCPKRRKIIDPSSANTRLAAKPMPRLTPMVLTDAGVVSAAPRNCRMAMRLREFLPCVRSAASPSPQICDSVVPAVFRWGHKVLSRLRPLKSMFRRQRPHILRFPCPRHQACS